MAWTADTLLKFYVLDIREILATYATSEMSLILNSTNYNLKIVLIYLVYLKNYSNIFPMFYPKPMEFQVYVYCPHEN